jgi:spore coat polysaccharide biosynthesis protein SpsF (cytidylyltransferase family)
VAIKYVIQAREGSARWPGKCFSTINHKWCVQMIIDACKRSKYYSDGEIVFVIPKNDKELRHRLKDYRIYTSTNKNCLKGYLEAARPKDIVVRLTADSPLIETEQIDLNIDKVLEGYDYASNEITMFGNCCEAFKMEALTTHMNVKEDKVHVTPTIRIKSNAWINSLMLDYEQAKGHIEDYLND